MTDETSAAAVDPAAAPVVEAAAGMTVEDVQAKRNQENLERAKAGGYVEPEAPSMSERVNVLVDSVARAMEHNAPISLELFTEMKALLGHKPEDPAAGEHTAV